MSGGIAIFVKTPGLSPVKTRLATVVGRGKAETLHLLSAEAVASVAREAALASGYTVYWAVAESLEDTAEAWTDLPRMAQGEGSLGQRMDTIYRQLRQRHGRALLLGADVPQLQVESLLQACDWLAGAPSRLALGPAVDGGFWTFAGNVDLPTAAWMRPTYGDELAAAQFMQAMHGYGRWLSLTRLHDVDRSSDLALVHAALSALHKPTQAQQRLREWMEAQQLQVEAAT